MFVNLRNNNEEFKAILIYKNKKASLISEYVKDIERKFDESHKMLIEIPNKVTFNGEIIDNAVFDLFKGKGQKIEVITNGFKEKFYITQRSINNENGVKTLSVTAMSDDHIISEKTIILDEDKARKLVHVEGDLDTSLGMLDLACSQIEGWSIGKVDDGLVYEKGYQLVETELNVLNNLAKTNINRGDLLYELDVELNPIDENNSMNFRFAYFDINTTTSDNTPMVKDMDITHTIKDLYTGVRKIQVYYDRNDKGAYSLKYVFTMSDGLTVTKWADEFIFLDSANLNISNIKMGYTTGQEELTQMLKIRNFELGSYNALEFLRKNICRAYNVYLEFDTYNRKINVRNIDYGRFNGIQVSWDNYVKSINTKELTDDIVSKAYVESSIDGVSMNEVCPWGDYFYDYSYFINQGMFSDELMVAWNNYKVAINGVDSELFTLRGELNTKDRHLIKLESERYSKDLAIRDKELARTEYISRKQKENTDIYDATISTLSSEINSLQDSFANILTQIVKVEDEIKVITDKIKSYRDLLHFKTTTLNGVKIFNEELLDELDGYTFTKQYDDSTYTNGYLLYANYQEIVKEANKNQIEANIEIVDNFIQQLYIPKGLSSNDFLKLGDKIRLRDCDELVEEEKMLRIIGYTYYPNYANGVCNPHIGNLKLTNKKHTIDEVSNATELKMNLNRNNNYTNTYKNQWDKSLSVNKNVENWLTHGLDAKAMAIKNQSGCVKYNMTESGLYIIDNYDENNQIYIGASMICFTKDRWSTVQCAIDCDGVIAKTIYGELILGKQLNIIAKDFGFWLGVVNDEHSIDENGKHFGMVFSDYDSVTDRNKERIFLGLEKQDNGNTKTRFMLKGEDGELNISEDGIINHNTYEKADNISPNYPMYLKPFIPSEVSKISSYLLHITIEKYRGFTKSVASGGESSVNTTSDGGATTTSSGGGTTATSEGGGSHGHMMFAGYGNNEATPPVSRKRFKCRDLTGIISVAIDCEDYFKGGLSTWESAGYHTHDVTVRSHTHSVGNHKHTVNINTSHNHNLVYSIHEEASKPTNITLKVNGVFVASVQDGSQIDIKQYLRIGERNIIELSSPSNCRCNVNVFEKSFIRW